MRSAEVRWQDGHNSTEAGGCGLRWPRGGLGEAAGEGPEPNPPPVTSEIVGCLGCLAGVSDPLTPGMPSHKGGDLDNPGSCRSRPHLHTGGHTRDDKTRRWAPLGVLPGLPRWAGHRPPRAWGRGRSPRRPGPGSRPPGGGAVSAAAAGAGVLPGPCSPQARSRLPSPRCPGEGDAAAGSPHPGWQGPFLGAETECL